MIEVTLILSGNDGAEILRRFLMLRPEAVAGGVGQAAHEMYGEARRLGHSPVGTVLRVLDGRQGDQTPAVVARAQAIVRASSRRSGRS